MRDDLELPMEFEVDERHREQIRFSPESTAADRFVTAGRALDISLGGLGLVTEQFLPRKCEGTVRIFDPQDPRTTLFEHRVKVQRVTMHGHELEYGIGVAFTQPADDLGELIRALKERCEAARDSEEGGGHV